MTIPSRTIDVLKFGGSSFIALHDFSRVARYLVQRQRQQQRKLAVVVSGITGTTGNLQNAGLALNASILPRTLDALLATAEMVGAALLEAAVSAEACSVTSLNGFQVGIESDDNFTRARIRHFDVGPLREALRAYDIVIVTGGQAITSNRRLTMLGRNSSDLTAVALAAATHQRQCEIFSDVCGVYTSDPYLVRNVQILEEVPFDACFELSRSGAKVIDFRAVDHARRHGVRILCKSLDPEERLGTMVGVGSGKPCIVPNPTAGVYQFDAVAFRTQILERLSAHGVGAIPVDWNEVPYLAIAAGPHNVYEMLGEDDQHFALIPHLRMVTELGHMGTVRRYLVAAEELGAFTQTLHDKHYPFVRAEERAMDGRSKPRSAMSSILLGGTPPSLSNQLPARS